MASKYVIGEKNLLRIIFSNKHITLHAFNNKSAHIFCHASSQTPAIREQLLADKAAWATAQRLPTMTQKTSAVAKVFADRLRELGVPELTYERDHQRGGKQVSSCSRLRAGADQGGSVVAWRARLPPPTDKLLAVASLPQRYRGVVKECIDTLRANGVSFKQLANRPGTVKVRQECGDRVGVALSAPPLSWLHALPCRKSALVDRSSPRPRSPLGCAARLRDAAPRVESWLLAKRLPGREHTAVGDTDRDEVGLSGRKVRRALRVLPGMRTSFARSGVRYSCS